MVEGKEAVPERRDDAHDDNGVRRRSSDFQQRQDEFRLLRDKVLLAVGVIGVTGIGIAAVSIGVRDSALALAALTVFATLLGIPTALRLDEKRRNNGDG